jgi:hypothetical protein
MLSVEENEALTHVGPGTVMGDLLRQYRCRHSSRMNYRSQIPPRCACACSAKT